MTALLLHAKCQWHRTIHSPKRLNVLLILALAIAALGVALAFQAAPQAITYPQRFITATPSVVCPGDTFTYPVIIAVDDGDAVSRITEGWCKVGGICPKHLQDPDVYINFLEAQNVTTPATRIVPDKLTPGDWQLRHCNETHSTGQIAVVCYQVALTVRDDCAIP